MDNQLTPCPEPKKRAESEKSTAGNPFTHANGRVMQSLNFTTLNDVLSLDDLPLPEEECFVLAKEYVLLEEEYVMWNEDYTSRPKKKTVNGKGHSFDEGELSIPSEEIHQYLKGSFQA